MRKQMIRVIAMSGATLFGAALFLFLFQQTGVDRVLAYLGDFGATTFILFLALSFANFALYTLRWWMILREGNTKIHTSYRALFLHRMSGFAAGYLTPGAQIAGEPVRVALLSAGGVQSAQATSSVVLDLAFEISAFLTYVLLGIVLALMTGIGLRDIGGFALCTFFIVTLLMVGFFVSVSRGWRIGDRLVSHPFFSRHPKIYRIMAWLSEVEHIMTQFFQGHGLRLFAVIALSLTMTGFRMAEMILIAWGFGFVLSPGDAILLSTIPGLVLLIPVPGGLGLFEASTSAMLTALGITFPGVAFTLIIRLRDFIFIVIGALHAVREGVSWMGRKKV